MTKLYCDPRFWHEWNHRCVAPEMFDECLQFQSPRLTDCQPTTNKRLFVNCLFRHPTIYTPANKPNEIVRWFVGNPCFQVFRVIRQILLFTFCSAFAWLICPISVLSTMESNKKSVGQMIKVVYNDPFMW